MNARILGAVALITIASLAAARPSAAEAPWSLHEVFTAVVVESGSVEPLGPPGARIDGEWIISGAFVAGDSGAVLVGIDGFRTSIAPGDFIDVTDWGFPAEVVTDAEGATTVTTICSLNSCGRGERFCGYCDGGVATCRCLSGASDQTRCKSLGGSDGGGGSYSCSVSGGGGGTASIDAP